MTIYISTFINTKQIVKQTIEWAFYTQTDRLVPLKYATNARNKSQSIYNTNKCLYLLTSSVNTR